VTGVDFTVDPVVVAVLEATEADADDALTGRVADSEGVGEVAARAARSRATGSGIVVGDALLCARLGSLFAHTVGQRVFVRGEGARQEREAGHDHQ
jgi:hypothetical protein